MRFRYVYMIVISIIVTLLHFLMDPDLGLITELYFGAGLIATLLVATNAIYYVTLLHFSRKALFDYIDLEEFFNKAKETSQGAGQALIAVAIAMVSIALVILAAVK